MRTVMEGDLQATTVPVAELCHRCREETARFRRQESHDDRFCFAVIRRAIVERDNDCWLELLNIYHDLVLSWCRRNGAGPEANLEELVALTWEKFWQYFTPARLAEASGTASVLAYLRMCARAVVIDIARAQHPTLPLEAAAGADDGRPTPADIAAMRAEAAALWELVDGHLENDVERVLVQLTFELGMRPAQVHAARPDLFPSVRDVYRITRNVLDRLRRSRKLRDWLADSGWQLEPGARGRR